MTHLRHKNLEHRHLFTSTFIGRIGDSNICDFNQIYQNKIQNCMDEIHLLESTQKLPTGLAAGLTFQDNRCLLADLGAVDEGIQNFLDIEKLVDLENFDLFYIPGMFIGSSGTNILDKIYELTMNV